MKLRPYQSDLIEKARQSLGNGFRSPLVVSSTGSGKTFTCAKLIESAVSKGKRVLFIAPRRQLVDQTAKVFIGIGLATGVIMAGRRYQLHKQVQVASFDTLVARYIRKDNELPEADVVILDEAHLSTSSQRLKLLERYRGAGAVVMGLTATPCRGNGSGLPFYDDIVQSWDMRQMIEGGYLAPIRYFSPTKPDLERVKVTAGEYNQKQLAGVMNRAEIIGDIVSNWKTLANDKPTLISCVDIKHSIAVCDEFNSHGIAAEHMDCNTDEDDRQAIIARVESGQTKVLCNVFLLSYGVDIPCLEVCVIARPTKSVVLYMQVVGRVLRLAEGKDYATVIDHSGVIAEHGRAEDITEWSLGEGTVQERQERQAGEEKKPMEIECTACHTIFSNSRACPNCGHQLIPAGDPIPCHEAVLVELDDSDKDQRKWNKSAAKELKQQFLGELISYADSMGYKKGWVAHQYRERSGVWPNAIKAEPLPPTELVKNWIKHQAIKRSRGYQA